MNLLKEYTDMEDFEELLEQAVYGGMIQCEYCGNFIEPDASHCYNCGWVNPLVKYGFI